MEEGDQTREGAKELRLFPKEFGQGVRQQRVRGETQEKPGTLPLAISMMKRIMAPQTQSLNMLEELQGLYEERGDHLVTGTSVENYSCFFQKEKLSFLSITTQDVSGAFFSNNSLRRSSQQE